nr:outer membrane beta-barrel protein [uncultured Flavobacterium sp.]
MVKYIKLILFLGINTLISNAQQKDSLNSKLSIDFSGYVDTYFTAASSYGNDEKIEPYLYNYTKKNKGEINLALFKTQLTFRNLYAKVGIQTGTYAKANYPKAQQWLNEATIGVKISTQSSLEAGILPSYIGFETATAVTNLTASRSLLAENSPYYMTGIKFNQQFNEKWFLAVMLSNGWQTISNSVNKLPAFGTQVQYKPNENTLYNWSTFIGDVPSDEHFSTRFFSNFYVDKTWANGMKTQLGLDMGWQQRNTTSGWAMWYSPVLIQQYQFNTKWAIAYRIEYYHDKENILIQPAILLPFKTIGNSLNFDYSLSKRIKCRTEGKWYHASENVLANSTKKNNLYWLTTLSYSF